MLNELDKEEEQLVAMAVALASSKKRIQTNAINAERDSFGELNHIFPQLLSQEDHFLMYFRIESENYWKLTPNQSVIICLYTRLTQIPF